MKHFFFFALLLIYSAVLLAQNKPNNVSPSNESSVIFSNNNLKQSNVPHTLEQLTDIKAKIDLKSKSHNKKSTENLLSTTRYVELTGSDVTGTGTAAKPWRTIKYAVAHSIAEDAIWIGNGTFIESGQIVIDKDLWIAGNGPGVTILQKAEDSGNPSSGDARAWFLVTSAVTTLFEFSDLTLDGTGRNISIGVLSNAVSIWMHGCEIKNISWLNGGPPNYYGRGICAYSGSNNITQCTFENIGRIGVFTFGVGVLTNIIECSYTGKSTGDYLDYGFEVGGGAEIAVYWSSISGCKGVAAVDGSTSAGILATTYWDPGTAMAAEWCTITNCETAVAVGYDGSDATIAVVRNDNLEGNDYAIWNSNSSNITYAPLNWYGSNSPAIVKSLVSTGVDYSPWLDSDYDIDPGYPAFDPDLSVLWVDDDSPKFYPALGIIQEGIDLVSGSTVNVAAGTYTGNITINKSLTLVGDPGDALPGSGVNAPIIDGGSAPGDAFLIANGVTNVTIKGFEMRNFTSPLMDGIGNGISAWVGSTSNITVQDNYFHNLGYNGVLVGNDKTDPGWGDHSNWIIKNNIIENFGYIGFELTNTSNSSIENNIIHLNTPYIGAIFSSARRSESGLTIKNNLIDGTPSTAFPVIYMYAYDLDMPNPNLNSVLIENNSITTVGTPAQIYIRNIGTGTVTGVTVANNNLLSLSTNTPAVITAVNNYWGSTNGPVHSKNVFNMGSQGGKISVSTGGTFPVFCPWWKDISGAPGSFSGTSFAPITNNDIPTENYSNFTDAIAGTTVNGIISAVAGTYTDSIDIQKPLSILGQGSAVTIIDRSTTPLAGTVVSIHNLAGNVTVDGFTIKTGPASTVASNGISINNLTGPGTITISHNEIWGVQSATQTAQINYGLIAGYFAATTPKLVFDHNTVWGGSDNPILIEKWMGPTEITNNTLYQNPLKDFSSSDVIFMMNYDGNHNNAKQLISGNTIDMGWGTVYNNSTRGTGISIAASYTGGTSSGGFTNVEIKNNTLINLKPSRRGIGTWNNSSDGSSGEIVNAVISGNNISNATGYTGEYGIRILGKATGTQILNNKISGVIDAVKMQPYNGHEANTTSVNYNSLLGTTYGLNNLTSALVNTSGNWWGDLDPSDNFNGSVDYTPWLNVGTDTDLVTPGFQPNLSTLWVDDNSPQSGTTGRIQEAVDMVSGSTINVLAGTYNENLIVNKYVTIDGEGNASNPLTNTVINGNGAIAVSVTASGLDVANRLTLKDLYITGGTRGINVGNNASFLKFDHVSSVLNTTYGIQFDNASLSNEVLITYCQFNQNGTTTNGVGLRLASNAKLYNLDVDHSEFNNNNSLGIYAGDGGAWYQTNLQLDQINISSSTFNNNPLKGIYIESMSNAIFDGITVNGSGTLTTSHSSGIDINLKYLYGTGYENITIQNSTITGCGINDPNGAGLLIKARSSYGGARLNNADVLNSSITNNGQVGSNYGAGIRIGEANNALFGADVYPTDVNIESCKITGNSKYGIRNAMNGILIDATYNWWGDASGPLDTKSLPGTPNYNNPGGLGNPVTSYVDYKPFNIYANYYNTPATAYKIYLSKSPNPIDSMIYPNDTWSLPWTTPPPPYPGDVNDWGFKPDVDFYIAPEQSKTFYACTITLEWDSTQYSLDSVRNGNIFASGYLTSLLASSGVMKRLTIDAGPLSVSNYTTSIGDYIAKVSLKLLKPGYAPVNFYATDFRYYDGAGGQLGVYVTEKNAKVKSYLGDVASTTPASDSTGDGLINIQDLTAWTSSYWSGVAGGPGMANYKVKYDIGPTTTTNVYGVPVTDLKIQFEDLVIFSISYGLSGNTLYPKVAPVPETPVEVTVGKPIAAGSQTLVPVYISGTVQDLRAASLSFSGSFGKFIGAENGDLLTSYTTPVMLLSRSEAGKVYVDLSLAGFDVKGLSQEGQLVMLRFEGKANVNITSADLRNIANSTMLVKLGDNTRGIPTEFGLSQNYPNPFNPATVISYQVPGVSAVRIDVFNSIGEKITTLVNEVKEPGYYDVTWNASSMPSGVYFFRINAGEFSAVKKMMLTK